MTSLTRFLVALCCALSVLYSSCKKDPVKKTTCASTLHCFTGPLPTSLFGTCSYGIINPSTGAVTSPGASFTGNWAFTTRGTFCTSDNCYYTLNTTSLYPPFTCVLYKMGATGAVTALAAPDAAFYYGIVYNTVNNRFYCFRNDTLVQLSTGSSSFTTSVATTSGYPATPYYQSASNITVNSISGDIYFTTIDTPNFYIRKYHPASATTTVVASGPIVSYVAELRFNKNDNMLYGIKRNGAISTFYFMKVDPSTGTITTVADIGDIVNVDFYSATLDACSNRYILSTMTSGSVISDPALYNHLYQFNMGGIITAHDTTTNFCQGLDVQY